MIDSKEPQIITKWISSTKDSVFITKELIYYGKFDPKKTNATSNREIPDKMDSIPLSYLTSFQIDRNKKTTTLEYGSSTILIRWDNPESINEFKSFLSTRFPGFRVLPREEKIKSNTRAPIAALIVIPCIYLIVLAVDARHSTGNTGRSGKIGFEAIYSLLQALKSMGILALTGLFGLFFLIALRALFRARKKSSHITVIELR